MKYPAAGRDAIQRTSDGYAYVEPARYHAEFAGDSDTWSMGTTRTSIV